MDEQAVNNEIYRQQAPKWWDDDVAIFSTLRFFVNPVRCAYFLRIFRQTWGDPAEHEQPTLLDVGCGGGFLSEEFARAGFAVTGIDPAAETIGVAEQHASASGLTIDYRVGAGESLPCVDASFDCVACCDVLEHVDDLERVVKEVARVLKPGGFFFYDTINRTLRSKITAVNVPRPWRSTAFDESNGHVWSRFIKPKELMASMTRCGLDNRDMRGISPRANPLSVYLNLRRCWKGRISIKELARRARFGESRSLGISYMGYARRA
jgi:2-polyprenyl-6-hydroxyphenyl methylase/3-demethylubiquinone-9 3-methyltransferase